MDGGFASTGVQPSDPVELRDLLDTRCPCSGALSLQYLQSSKGFSGTLGFYLVTEASKCRPHRLFGTLILCFLGFHKQMIRNVRKVNISFCLTQLHYSGLLNQQVVGQLKILSTTHFFHLVKEKPTLCLILFITSLSSKRECSQTKKMSLFFLFPLTQLHTEILTLPGVGIQSEEQSCEPAATTGNQKCFQCPRGQGTTRCRCLTQ